MHLLSSFIVLAARGHEGQFDKGGVPYILHPMAVMDKVRQRYGVADYELLCMAIGHDLIEDGKINGKRVTYGDLRAIGSTERVIAGIAAMTRVPGETEEEYQAKVLANFDACRCKQADLEHNSDLKRLKGVTEKDMQRVVKYYAFYARINIHLHEQYKLPLSA
jgi:(p)ppGpp synthase/HD superfamily hydrolase